MTPESAESGVLGAAVHRLDRALSQLELRVSVLSGQAASGGELFDHDRAQLASALDAARGRERDLQAAGSLASQALGRAIADIRAALGDEESAAGAPDAAFEADIDVGVEDGDA